MRKLVCSLLVAAFVLTGLPAYAGGPSFSGDGSVYKILGGQVTNGSTATVNQVLTKQADGTLAFAAVGGAASSLSAVLAVGATTGANNITFSASQGARWATGGTFTATAPEILGPTDQNFYVSSAGVSHSIYLTTPSETAGNNAAGDVRLTGGNGFGSGSGGRVFAQGGQGNGSGTGAGGIVEWTGGTASDGTTGGDITVFGGINGGAGNSGRIIMQNGAGTSVLTLLATAAMTITGDATITDSSAANTTVFTVNKTPAGTQSGSGVLVTMGANSSGDGLKITAAAGSMTAGNLIDLVDSQGNQHSLSITKSINGASNDLYAIQVSAKSATVSGFPSTILISDGFTATAVGVGSGVVFGGKMSTQTNNLAAIAGVKEAADTGALSFGVWTGIGNPGIERMRLSASANALKVPALGGYTWVAGTDLTAAPDTGITRDSPGVVDFGTGAQASVAGSWKATNGTLTGTLSGTTATFAGGTVTANTPLITTSEAQNATSGTVNLANFAATFADGGTTSTTVGRGIYLNPTYNYTAGSKTGSNADFQIDRVETSLASGSQFLMLLRAGAAGTTTEFSVTNLGNATATGTVSGNSLVSSNNINSSGAGVIYWNGQSHMTSPADSQIGFTNSAASGFQGLVLGVTVPTFPASAPTHAQSLTIGTSEELLTLSTVGLTTDTTANLLPAGAIILSVTCRVTTTITTTTNWAVGDNSGTANARFSSANATLTSGTTSVGINHTNGGVAAGAGMMQTSAAKVRITCTGSNPGAGVIRITTHYIIPTAATS